MSQWGDGLWGIAYWGITVARGACLVKLSSPNRIELSAKMEVPVYSVLKSNLIKIEARFFKNGAYADPTTVTLAMKKPDGTALSPAQTLTRQSLGVWSCDFDTQGQAAGVWSFRAEGEGNCDSAAEGSFEIKASAVI